MLWRIGTLSMLAGCALVFPLEPPDRDCLVNEGFQEGAINPFLWTDFDPTPTNITVAVDGGALDLRLSANDETYDGIVSARTYDLRGKAFETTVIPARMESGVTTIVSLYDPASDSDVRIELGDAIVRAEVNNTNLGQIDYSPAFAAQVRLRHDPATNRVHAEAAAIDGDWSEIDQLQAPFDLGSAKVAVYAGVYDLTLLGSPPADPGRARFDDLLICVP